jgi:hypothetical protein
MTDSSNNQQDGGSQDEFLPTHQPFESSTKQAPKDTTPTPVMHASMRHFQLIRASMRLIQIEDSHLIHTQCL